MWEGYLEWDGNEVINVERTEAYAKHLPWFRPVYGNDALHHLLGHKAYRSPIIDDAPWADPDVAASYHFLGVYPLSVEGVESSTRSANIVESTTNGGVVGRIRHATKPVVFSCLLIATSEAGAEYGSRWLRRTLLSGPCGPGALSECFGSTLCYLSHAPAVSDTGPWPDGAVAAVVSGGDAFTSATGDEVSLDVFSGGDATSQAEVLTRSTSIFEVTTEMQLSAVKCLPQYLRSLHKVSWPTGPTVTRKNALSDGSHVWTVAFTATAGSPFETGPELEVMKGFLDPDVPVPWAGGVEPDGAAVDLDGYMTPSDEECNAPPPRPLYDPEHPALILPPSVPSVPLGHFDPPRSWRRRQFTIPRQYVPLWGEMVPLVRIHARTRPVRNLRIRFYADPFEVGDIADDPCAFCGDFVVSYVPEGYSLFLDGVEEMVTARGPGGVEQRADSLVFATDGTPFTWPTLSCGFGYVVTLDLPETQAPPVVDLSLVERML